MTFPFIHGSTTRVMEKAGGKLVRGEDGGVIGSPR